MLEKELRKVFEAEIDKKKWFSFRTENSNGVIIPGFPDMILINRKTNKMIGIEFKVGTNKQRINQVWMEKVFVDNAIVYYVVDDLNYEKLVGIINGW